MPEPTDIQTPGTLVCVGLNYKTTPVEVRERLAFPETVVPDAVREIRSLPGFGESLVLSTCNRVELYAAHELQNGPQSHAALREYLVSRFQLQPEHAEALVLYHLDAAEAARRRSSARSKPHIKKPSRPAPLEKRSTSSSNRPSASAKRCATTPPSSAVAPASAASPSISRRRCTISKNAASCSSALAK
jgi:hypothetical protein